MRPADRYRRVRQPYLSTLAPGVAREWLMASNQRMVKLQKVQEMVRQMRAGEWDPDAHRNTPVIYAHSQLLDGHHRATAVIVFGEPVRMWMENRAQ